ncbi:MAG: glycoside hydrolase family 5 protein [Proteobacteria bacterium]|nr:glycoside hydrolase family 5 protein [Pseudomonadota bacterium]
MMAQPPAAALAAAPARDTRLPQGYLSTRGSQIIDAAGQDVRIASVGWNQHFNAIQATVAAIAAAGFNTVRVSWDDADLAAARRLLIQIVAAASRSGLKVIIDHHNDEGFTNPRDGFGAQQRNGLWFDRGPGTNDTNGAGVVGTVTAAQFQTDWVTIARTFATNPTVIGFDLDNEPTANGHITWGGGGPTDIHAMAQTVGDAIQAVDPGALIIVEGPQNYRTSFADRGPAPAGDLTLAGRIPVQLTIPHKLVYSVHEYPTEISDVRPDSGPAAIAQMNRTWGYLVTQHIAPVWVGEMGSSMRSTNARAWAATLLGYMNGKDGTEGGPTFGPGEQPVPGDWWVWGYLPGQAPDGTLNAAGALRPAQSVAWRQLLPLNTEVPR